MNPFKDDGAVSNQEKWRLQNVVFGHTNGLDFTSLRPTFEPGICTSISTTFGYLIWLICAILYRVENC